MIWRILKYIQHLFHRRHRRGHAIHSPYVFEFVNGVVFNADRVTVPDEITGMHRALKKDRSMLPVGKLGATSNVDPAGDRSGQRSVGSFVKGSSVSEKYGALLHRITRWFNPEMVIELGTGLGVSTIYLASGSAERPLHSIEGNTDRADFAAHLINRCNLGFVSIHWGEMEEKLEELMPVLGGEGRTGRFVAFVDGNHRYEPTVAYVKRLIERAGEEAVIIMDDIYWSEGMNRAWKEVISWPEVRVTVDLYHLGILLLREDLSKAHIKVKF
ncbi:MAG: class I SAM-dependent methyltransferase [Bacteroidota bacterium]